MKYLCVITIMSLFLIVGCANDNQPARGQFQNRDAEMLKQLEEDLFLSQNQVDSIKVAMDENFKMMQGLREKFGEDRGAMRDTMRVLREQMNEKIMKFLDEDQKKDYERILEERRSMMRERRRQDN